MRPVCKHVVAAIFYLQKEILDIGQTDGKVAQKKEIKIRVFIWQENSKKGKKFRNFFLAFFGHLDQN